MPRNDRWGGERHWFLSNFVAIFSTKQCEASFHFYIANRSRSEMPVSRAFRITNPQHRSSWCHEMTGGRLQASAFWYNFSAYFISCHCYKSLFYWLSSRHLPATTCHGACRQTNIEWDVEQATPVTKNFALRKTERNLLVRNYPKYFRDNYKQNTSLLFIILSARRQNQV